jgi:hypothetical protein
MIVRRLDTSAAARTMAAERNISRAQPTDDAEQDCVDIYGFGP